MAARAIRLYGTENVDPPLRTLRAGPLSVEFDNGALRYVRIGGIEVLRGIAFLVRDENWGTFTPVIDKLQIDEAPASFRVSYRATCADASRRLVYEARIDGTGDGSLSFTAEAEPETDVLTNRTGFIVLHPIEGVAGQPVEVLHVDGREELSAFPNHVDPRCPFTNIRALSHEIAPGVWATCTMEGEAFEMEDQRNWSDASYKTYVRPLRRPWPYTLPKGQRFTQAIRLGISGRLPANAAAERPQPLTLALGEPIGRMPRIGIGVPADEARHALDRPDLMRRLSPKWLLCQVDLRVDHGRSELERHAALAKLTGAEIVLEIITKGTLDPLGELKPVAGAAASIGLEPNAVAVFPAQDMKSVQPDAPWPEMPSFEETYAAARKAFPNAKLGGGMATYFTELNRKRPPAGPLDYVTFTTCPNVHASDDISVMETLESLPHLIRSTRAFMGAALDVRIGPSQLGCRENAYGKSTAPNETNARVCLSRIDPRQRGLFNAAWILGYVAACARENIEAVALGAPTGPFGYIHRQADFMQPWYDDQRGALVYPAFHVLSGLSQLGSATLLSVEIAGQHKIAAIATRDGTRTTLWLGNLGPQRQTIELAGVPDGMRVTTLSTDQFERAAVDPDFLDTSAQEVAGRALSLDSYAVIRADLRSVFSHSAMPTG